MKIHQFADFPNPRRVRIFLSEKGLDNVEFNEIDVPGGAHRQASYLAKNPYGTVPTLELDDGTCISETIAICRYFEEAHPENPLFGDSAQSKAEIEMWQRRIEQSLFDPIAAYFHHATPGLGELEVYQNAEWGQANLRRFQTEMERLDDQLADRPFVGGNRYSIADITGLCAIDYAIFVDVHIPDNLDNLRRWYNTVASRPSAHA